MIRNRLKRLVALLCALVLCLGMASVFASCADNEEEENNVKMVDNSNQNIQYVVFMVTNIYYERLEPYIREMIELHGEIDPNSERMYAFGVVGPMTITQSIEEMQREVNYVFELAERYNVPVFFQMDDCTNYSTAFGDGATIDEEGNKYYNDPEMCEWIAFPQEGEEWGGQSYGALPRWHCGWGGTPFATAGGFPCFNSEKYLNWYSNQVKEGFIKPLVENYSRLQEEGKAYLFAGVNTGWETQIPDYSEDSILSPGGLASCEDYERAQYGMHALYNLGYDEKSLKREAAERHMTVDDLEKELLYQVLADYIEFTCKMFYDAGIGRHKIFSHTISLSSELKRYDTQVVPTWVSINDYCTPGWTMSPVTCQYDLSVLEQEIAELAPDVNAYSNAEGYAHYNNEETCTAYFEESLCGNARMITVFGYDQSTGQYGYQKSPDFYFVKVVRKWLAYEIGPDYTWETRPVLTAN